MKIKFFLDNVQVNPPKNWRDLELELCFEKDKNKNRVTTSDFQFYRNECDLIHNWRNQGLTGGAGVLNAMPFRIEIEKGSDVRVIFDGYLDFSESTTWADKESVFVSAKEVAQIDKLNDEAYSFGLDYLKAIGEISSSDYLYMPYVLNSVPNYRDSIIAVLAVYTVTMQLLQQVTELTNILIAAANPFEATALIRIIIQIAYIIILLIALIKLLKDLVNLLIQPVKYHACMTVKKQLEACCSHMNLQFSSEFFDSGAVFEYLTIMPEKYFVEKSSSDDRILGFLQPDSVAQDGFYKGTFGQLLQEMKNIFKAKVLIKKDSQTGLDTLYLIRKDRGLTQPLYQVPPVDDKKIRLNLNDFKSNYNLYFQYDLIDKNTIQNYEGIEIQVYTRPAFVPNVKYTLNKGFEQVSIGFARAHVKTELTLPEKIVLEFLNIGSTIVNDMVKVVNTAIDIYNSIAEKINKIIDKLDTIGIKINIELKSISPLEPVDFGEIIENRIGMMLLEQDQIGKAKIFLINIGSSSKFNKIASNNSEVINAQYLYDNYHIVDGFLPYADNPNANQYFLKDLKNVPFDYFDYLNVLENNQCLNAANMTGEVTSVKWKFYHQIADVSFKINQLYLSNLVQTKIVPNGK